MDQPTTREIPTAPSPRLRLLRLHEIDRQLRAGRHPNARTLGEALEVSARTIQRDLEFLRDSMGAPLLYDASERGYRYTEPTFALPALTLSASEIAALETAKRYLGRLTGSALGDEIEALLTKLESLASAGAAGRAGPVETLLPVPQARTDAGRYEEIRRAIREGRTLRCRYRSAGGGASERRLDPYDLLFWDGAWYVVGHCHLRGEPRIFALTRLRRATPTEARFEVPAGWSLERFLEGAFALFVSPEGTVAEPVLLRFRGYAARYVSERRWHRSQRLERLAAGEVRLALTLPLTPSLERFVLGWGDEVVVERPSALADRVAARMESALGKYGSVRPGGRGTSGEG